MSRNNYLSKILSANDTGETGGHQAGILIPKNRRILDFFPRLNKFEKNPRFHIKFYDEKNQEWVFAFIYYNNKLFGGTRNEYRLTRMSKFVRTNNLKEGDEIIFYLDPQSNRRIGYIYGKDVQFDSDGVLRIGSSWKIINV